MRDVEQKANLKVLEGKFEIGKCKLEKFFERQI
jgi:hypothetical protein